MLDNNDEIMIYWIIMATTKVMEMDMDMDMENIETIMQPPTRCDTPLPGIFGEHVTLRSATRIQC